MFRTLPCLADRSPPIIFMRTLGNPVLHFLCLAAVLLLSAGCATVAGDYQVPANSVAERGYTSVAGNIEVGRSARIGNAKTVAGNIEIGEQSRVGTLSSVAGRIRVGMNVRVGGSIKTVAGDIEVASGCTITGDVGSVAGRITLQASTVKGDVTLTSGKLAVTGSRVSGTVRIERADDRQAEDAEVTIGPDSEVAKVVVEKDARAQLRIHRTAKVGAVKGVVAQYYD